MRWALLALALLDGCAAGGACVRHDHRPLVIKSRAPRKALIDAAYQAARNLGAAHVDLSEEEGWVKAVVDEQESARTRLHVQVTEWGEVAVDVRIETKDREGDWATAERVCENDPGEARQREVAEYILAGLKQ
jgi:hypothetical protein